MKPFRILAVHALQEKWQWILTEGTAVPSTKQCQSQDEPSHKGRGPLASQPGPGCSEPPHSQCWVVNDPSDGEELALWSNFLDFDGEDDF